MSETIYALSSGAVPAGVAVIRVSGPMVRAITETLAGGVPRSHRASLRKLRHPVSGEVLDEALVLLFQAPRSFTGEDVVELHCHGGRAVVSAVLSALEIFPDCRPAEAGEFTRRAFDHGRLDLTEVEGLADLIAAETEAQRKLAFRQMQGALGTLYEDWRKRLIRMRAMVEADFDFADEEDVPGSVANEVWQEAEALGYEIDSHLQQSGRHGERLREGLQVVLMGAPNAGKSSLLNALAGREVAIVTEEAGTTRDVIDVHLDLGGYPVTLVDTAGLRETVGVVEQEGIRRALLRGEGADLILWAKAPDGLSVLDDPAGLKLSRGSVPLWEVLTKVDLNERSGADFETPTKQDSSGMTEEISVSVKTRDGLEGLIARLTDFASQTFVSSEVPLATRQRHKHYLTECANALAEAVGRRDLPNELRAEDLRRAADALGRITGRIDVEDLLDVIFGEFCVGK